MTSWALKLWARSVHKVAEPSASTQPVRTPGELLSEQTATVTPVTAMFTWQGGEGRELESARVLLSAGGMRALGRVIRAPLHAPAFTASYRLIVDEQGVVARLSVTSASAERERNLALSRTEDGYWLLENGSGGARAEFGGALDVELESSPLYNALPIRRLGLHRQAGDQELPVVFVSLPSLEVKLGTRHYRTESTLGDDQRAIIGLSSGDFSSELVVDADGLVIDYPGVAVRI